MKKKIKEKILIINYEFPPLGGGGGVASYDLALEWVKNYDVDVLTSSYKDIPSFEVMKGINIHRVGVLGRNSRDAASFLSMYTYLITGFFKGIKLARKNKYTAINTHFAVPSGPLGYIISRIFRIPNVLSIHGGDIYDPSKKTSPHRSLIFKAVVKFVLNHADRVVAQSSNTQENALKYYSPNKSVDIIPLAYHPQKKPVSSFKLPELKKGEFSLITIGRLVKRKSVETIIEAFAKEKELKLKLYVLGDGPEKEFLMNLSEKLGVRDKIYFAGFVTEKRKYEYLNLSDAYIMTSLHEGFGIVFMEAMDCSLPIICTNHGGQTDFLFHEKNALMINVGDVSACAESIKRMVKDKKLYQKLAKNNKADVRKFYAENVAKQYEDIFKVLADKK
ncbi:MAG TPA: glycosyltransferase family 4 protein [Spirochaetota bacterium]|nr:glycosyltransferase family 4 protein [Spirochaetota bacterium]HOR45033.1 glycosyltransferase family 4 protein [Spirochaetota bacterium]HPK56551.1 glycosyltransferase family 4 protein [Spirochaetota bacterium]